MNCAAPNAARRRTGTKLIVLGLSAFLLACDELTGSDAASLDIVPVTETIERGDTFRLTAIIRDSHGREIRNGRVSWSSANELIVTVSSTGLVTGVATGGPVLITASSGDESAVAQITVRPAQQVTPTVAAMLQQLGDYIASALLTNQAALPLNPRLADVINARIALLQRPTLATEIIDGRFYEETSTLSSNNRNIPIVSVFPLANLRGEARTAIDHVSRTVVVLEQLMNLPFPTANIRVWQGFIIGNSGGGGVLNMEDQATYEARTPETRLPYHAIVSHEVGHSYFGSESLTQFLELYAYNLIRTGSSAIADWVFMRGYLAQQSSNKDVHALLDIYALIGRQAMSSALHEAQALHPRYGEPLSAEVRQVFIDAAPAAVRQQVAAKIATVSF